MLNSNIVLPSVNFRRLFILVAFAALTSVNGIAQTTLYFEQFNTNGKGVDGTTFDTTGVTTWSIDVSQSVTMAPGDYFKVVSGVFESYNTDAVGTTLATSCVWTSSVVNISGYTNVTLSADLSSISSNSTSGVQAYYSINGGAYISFGSKIGNGALVPANIAGLSGSTVQIKVAHWGTSTTPKYQHDNVKVVGTPPACTVPSVQASSLVFSNVTTSGMDLSWTNGNGTNVLVVAKQSTSTLTDPTVGTSYTANVTFGSGSQIGTGNYVVYNGTGNSVSVAGLLSGVTYNFAIYAYNLAGNCYNVTELSGTQATLNICTPPTTQATNILFSGVTTSSMNVSWTNGNGNAVLVVAKLSTSTITDPTLLSSYTANAVFGLGSQIGTGNYVVYNGTGNTVAVTGLSPNLTYNFAVYTYFSGTNCYNLVELSGTQSTVVVASPYEMDVVNGLTINTCSGVFRDAGGTGGYTNNENYTVTFCSGTGTPLSFDFSGTTAFFDIDCTGDTLFAYDGTSATGTPIAILTWLDDATQTVYSSQMQLATKSTCVTFKWKSDGSCVDAGWEAAISCAPVPVCSGNPGAADIFAQATEICNTTNYCGNTGVYYGEDTPFNIIGGGACPVPDDAIFGGTIENNSWLKFQALAPTATLTFVVTGSGSCTGIQVGIYEFNAATSLFTLKSPCSMTDGNNTGTFSVTASSLTIGNIYYIMIDGSTGSDCDYSLSINTGVAVANAGADKNLTCNIFSTTLNATSTLSTGTWSVVSGSGTFSNINSPTSTVSGLAPGVNTFRWTTTTSLCGIIYDDITVNTLNCPLPIELVYFDGKCNGENINIKWQTASEKNNGYFVVEKADAELNFKPIAKINGSGNSTEIKTYEITDYDVWGKTMYYKLTQTDMNGHTEVAGQISVNTKDCKLTNDFEIKGLINPFENEIQFDIVLSATCLTNCKLINDKGQLIKESSAYYSEGLHKINWSSEEIKPGIYFLRTTTLNKSVTNRIIKL